MPNGPMFESAPGWGGQLNSWLRQNLMYVVPAVVVLVLVIIWIATRNGNEDIATGTPTWSTSTATPLPAGTLAQTVQPRDNYTLVSRRAITQYLAGLPAKLSATPGQRLYAETILQSKIQNQPLIVGQQISFQQSEIQSTLDSYATLTSSQKARWELMARKVRF